MLIEIVLTEDPLYLVIDEILIKILIFICRKTIEIPISEEDSYEKNVVMYVVIGEPRHIAGNLI